MAVSCIRCWAGTCNSKCQPRTCAQIVSEGSPCSPCKERAEVRRQIKHLEEKIAELKAKYNTTLAAAMNAAHDPFIHKFPPEIVSHIFRLSLPTLHYGDDNERPGQGPSSIRTVWDAPLKLGSVCRRWRELAWATPSLWTTLYLAIKHTTRNSTAKTLPALLSEWLGRSGALPLTIHFFYGTDHSEDASDADSYDETSSMSTANEIATSSVIDILNSHSSRWRNLHIKARGNIFELFSIPDEPTQLATLDLEVLGEYPLPGPEFVESVLNPTRLRLVEFPLKSINVRWDNITHATLWLITIDEGLEFLRGAPRLECYRVSMYETDDIGPINPILHPRLRSLHLETDYPKYILDIINVPSLEEWTQDVVGEWSFAAMLSFIERSGCCLKTLNLHGVSPPTEGFVTLLQAIPSLERIQLSAVSRRGEDAIDAILRQIFCSTPGTVSVEHRTSECFLPHLQFIECTPHSWDTIPELYRHGHRRSITLKASDVYVSDISDRTALQLLQLRDEGVDLRIVDLNGRDFLENFRKRKRRYKALGR